MLRHKWYLFRRWLYGYLFSDLAEYHHIAMHGFQDPNPFHKDDS